MANWHRALKASDCEPGDLCEVVVGGRIVAIFNVDGQFYAMDGICPHQGGPVGKGTLQGCVVTCPWHGWQYDVRNGKHETSPLVHPTFPTKHEGDEIFVDLSED